MSVIGTPYVTVGAELICSFGSTTSKLKLPVSHGISFRDNQLLNIMDYKPMVNIMPFGLCQSLLNPQVAAATAAANGRLQKMPCIPVILSPWINGKTDFLIGNFPVLLKTCKQMCLYSGSISIVDDGQ